MPSGKELSQKQQMAFQTVEERFVFLPHLTDFPRGPQIIQRLDQEKLWQTRPRRQSLVVFFELGQQRALVINANNWQILGPFERKTKPKLTGVVVNSPPLEKKDAVFICENLEPLASRMIHQAPFFIFEEKINDLINDLLKADWRKEILKQFGLVKISVLTGQPNQEFIVWRGRNLKKKEGKLIDLTLSPKAEHYRNLYRQTVARLKKDGYRVVNADQIVAQLKASSFPPRDISALRLGFGFVVKDDQGQHWQIDLNGAWTKIPG